MAPRELFSGPMPGTPGSQYRIVPGGKRFLISMPFETDIRPFQVIFNRTALLGRKVPAEYGSRLRTTRRLGGAGIPAPGTG